MEPVFFGTIEQVLAQRHAWLATVSECDTCRKVITGLGHVDRITCADCWRVEQRARRAARRGQHRPLGEPPGADGERRATGVRARGGRTIQHFFTKRTADGTATVAGFAGFGMILVERWELAQDIRTVVLRDSYAGLTDERAARARARGFIAS